MSMSEARLLIARYRAALAEHLNDDGDVADLQSYDTVKTDYGLDALELLEQMVVTHDSLTPRSS